MSTFKTALRMALAHPFYLLIYTVFISLMGVFIAASVSWNSSQLTEYEPYDTNVIVVDRDNSDLSRALTKHLGSRFDLVTGHGTAHGTQNRRYLLCVRQCPLTTVLLHSETSLTFLLWQYLQYIQ